MALKQMWDSQRSTAYRFHDATVDRTTNGSGKVSAHTLAELKKLDAAYHFKDINGLTPYRGHAHTAILTFDELLKQYPDMYINVDLKDAPESYEGSIAPQIMFDTIAENQAFDRVLVTSFIKNKSSVLIKLHKDPLQLVLANRKLQRHF